MSNRDLEAELHASPLVLEKVKNPVYAQALYAAMCNIQWYTDDSKDPWTCSWRYSGGIVAELINKGGDYLDFYCSGIIGTGEFAPTPWENPSIPEGIVTKEIEGDLASLGWSWQHYPKEELA